MAKAKSNLDRRRLFNFYYFKKAIEDRVSVNKGAD